MDICSNTLFEKDNTQWVLKYELYIDTLQQHNKDELIDYFLNSCVNYRELNLDRINYIYENLFEFTFEQKLKDDGFEPDSSWEVFAKFIFDIKVCNHKDLYKLFRRDLKGGGYFEKVNHKYQDRLTISFEELEFIINYLLTNKQFDKISSIVEERIIAYI